MTNLPPVIPGYWSKYSDGWVANEPIWRGIEMGGIWAWSTVLGVNFTLVGALALSADRAWNDGWLIGAMCAPYPTPG